MDPTWKEALASEFKEHYFHELVKFVERERDGWTVYPPPNSVLSAFTATPFDKARVVILGQDPYHGEGQAHGLSFSVLPGMDQPPSLKNIFKELHDDLGCTPPKWGYLMPWAEQGVFLLNSVLTVRAHYAASHKGKGWERFTLRAIKALSDRGQVVFLLWGKYAKDQAWVIDKERNAVFTAAHPSPLSAHTGFFGSKPFSQANKQLQEWGQDPIDWQL